MNHSPFCRTTAPGPAAAALISGVHFVVAVFLVATLAVLDVAAQPSSKVSIPTGATGADVTALIGKPEYVGTFKDSIEVWRYPAGTRNFLVAFQHGRVVSSEWRNAASGAPEIAESKSVPLSGKASIQNGSTPAEVTAMIGEPVHVRTFEDSIEVWRYPAGTRNFLVAFHHGKVVTTEWRDAGSMAPVQGESRLAPSSGTGLALNAAPAADATPSSIVKPEQPQPNATAKSKTFWSNVGKVLSAVAEGYLEYETAKLAAESGYYPPALSTPTPVRAIVAPTARSTRSSNPPKSGWKSLSKECTNDYACGYGNKCVKPEGNLGLKGVCVVPVNEFGTKTYETWSPATGPHEVSSCSFNTDCSIGFKCVKETGHLYGLCVKK